MREEEEEDHKTYTSGLFSSEIVSDLLSRYLSEMSDKNNIDDIYMDRPRRTRRSSYLAHLAMKYDLLFPFMARY
jgi:hypothetical protein